MKQRRKQNTRFGVSPRALNLSTQVLGLSTRVLGPSPRVLGLSREREGGREGKRGRALASRMLAALSALAVSAICFVKPAQLACSKTWHVSFIEHCLNTQ